MDQFSKIALSFERKDAAGTMPPVTTGLGKTVISLGMGTWEITAEAYNATDPPAIVARAKNTLTRNLDNTIAGETHFALAPAGTGPGVLRYTVAPPAGITLDPAKSRIRIEKDGEAFAALNGEGFAAGERAISAAIDRGTVSLDPGRYVLDITLDDAASIRTAVCVESASILPGLVTDLVFEPEAGDFLDPDARAVLSAGGTFGLTKNNSSKTVVGTPGGTAPNKTQTLSVVNETDAVYFTLTKARTQTAVLGGPDAGKVKAAVSGTVDGQTASPTLAVFTADTASIAVPGGSLAFTVSLEENGKTPMTYTVTAKVDAFAYFEVETWPFKSVYMAGEAFDFSGLKLWGVYLGGKRQLVTRGYSVSGFDTSAAGTRLVVLERGGRSVGNFAITVLSPAERALVFWRGLTAAYEPMPNRYTVPVNRMVVLAPVKYYIPDNAVYEWKVDNVIQNGHTTEYFPYTATSSSGEHTVTVTAKVDGVAVASAETAVAHTGGAALRPTQAGSNVKAAKLYAVVAPGQFDEWGDGVNTFGAGGYGGHTILRFDHSVTKKPDGGEILIGGNAFAGWQEPGAIWVSQDDNNNGLADDTWYELAGSHTLAPLTLRNCAVTYRNDGSWVNNYGHGGSIGSGQAWPTKAAGITEITLVGTLLDKTYAYAALWGYADVVDNGKVSLSNAIQADGTPVDLPFIDFIKIVTALHFAESGVGERSTEAKAPKDLSLADPDRSVAGYNDSNMDAGQYRYTFRNNSGYDLTIEILEGGGTFSLAKMPSTNIPTEAVKLFEKSSIYFNYYGGNVRHSGNKWTVDFYDE
jgi:hypothetical protein